MSLVVLERHHPDNNNPAGFLCTSSSDDGTIKGNSAIRDRTTESVPVALQTGNIILCYATPELIEMIEKYRVLC